MPESIVQLRINQLQQQIQNLQEAYRRESDLLVTVSGAAEVEVESKLNLLDKKAKQLNAALAEALRERAIEDRRHQDGRFDELSDIVKEAFNKRDSRLFQQSFRQSLPPDSWRTSEPVPAGGSEMLNALIDAGQDGEILYTPLVIFIGKLICSEQRIVGLRDWLATELEQFSEMDAESQKVDVCLRRIIDYGVSEDESHSCLLVRVTGNHQQTAQEKQRKYTMQGWYIEDMEVYRRDDYDYSGVENVDLPGSSDTDLPTFAADELEVQLRRLVKVCFDSGCEWPESLQLFLPSELMGQPIDSWSAEPPEEGQTITFGTEHQEGVFIRSDARLNNRRCSQKVLRQRWQLLKREGTGGEFFLPAHEDSCNTLERQFSDKRKQIFGLKLTCLPHPVEKGRVKKNGFFDLLARLPIPAALWLRQAVPNSTCETVLDGVITAGRLADIPETIRIKRLADDDPEGQHLSLLWDDPFLLPP